MRQKGHLKRLSRSALALIAAYATAAADPTSAPPPPACVVSAGARSFDLAELGGGGGVGGAPPLHHVSRAADSLGWTYSFAACGAVSPPPAACAGAAPGSAALQQTAGACYGIGASATRSVAATATGVALSFSGGDGGRSSVVTVECADVARPHVVRWGSGAAPGSYTALVRARAGCALECGRDAATGAVCGGAARGICAADGSDGLSRCVCTSGFAGAACIEIRSSVSHGASAGNIGANSRIALGAILLVISVALWACVLRFVKLEAPLSPHTAEQSIGDILEPPSVASSGSMPLTLSVAFALMGALFFYSGAPSTNFISQKDSMSPAQCNLPAELALADKPRPLLVVYGNIELYFGSYTVKHFVATVRALKAQYGWREYVPLVNDPRDSAEVMEATMLKNFGRAPDVLLFLQDLALLSRTLWPRNLLNETKYMCWYDDTPRGFGSGMVHLLDADLLLPTYEYLLLRAPMLADVPRLWMPHSALPMYELPFNTAPLNKVLLVGHVEASYPMRQAVRNRMDRGDTRFEQFESPGWQPGQSLAHNDEFAAAIHAHIASIFDGSRNNFVVAKVMEVTATGALLLFSDDLSDALEALGFVDGQHWVSYNASSLDAVVDWVLDPRCRARVDSIRAAGQALSHSRHRTDARVDAIHAAALELARAKREGGEPNLDSVRRFPNYADWKRKDPRSAEYYADRAVYARARVLVEHEEGRRV
jgi:hypothetical protein